jgi:hypothetical protein
MTQKKSALAQHLADLLKDGTDTKELEKWTVQKLHYEIQKIEEEEAAKEPEAPAEPAKEPEPAPEPPKKKSRNLLQIILGDSSDDEE